MSGTPDGARKGRDTKIKKYGPDYYSKLASLAAKSRVTPTGFASAEKGKDGLTGPERSKKIWEKRKAKQRENEPSSDE